MSGALDDLFDVITEAQMTVIDPRTEEAVKGDGDEDWKITFAGPLHAVTKKLEKDRRTNAVMSAKSGRGMKAALATDFQLEELVARTLGWGPITRKGRPFPFTPENARALYSEAPVVKGQALVFITEADSFLPKPSTPPAEAPDTASS